MNHLIYFSDEIITKTGNKKVSVQHLDLSSFASVRKFAIEFIKAEKRLDILVNNAGAGGIGNKKTVDGLVTGMQVNHFGPFLLTCLLLGKVVIHFVPYVCYMCVCHGNYFFFDKVDRS